MRVERLENMTKGWFVGDFAPTVLRTDAVEVAVKHYRAGDREDWHFHKIATELTVVVSGEIALNGVKHVAGEIVVIEPNEGTDFLALTDAVTTVVKFPGAKQDKFLRGQ